MSNWICLCITDTSFSEALPNPNPSPDEMIIAARGRRSLPLTFSPDVHNTPLRHGHSSKAVSQLARGWQTPPNLPNRTSPRKRLTPTDSPPSGVPSSTSSPDKVVKRSPISKRIRGIQLNLQTCFELVQQDNSRNEANADTMVTMLKGLTQEQMVDLVANLIGRRPEIQDDVMDLMPAPDLGAMEDQLNYLKQNIFKLLPNTRLESKTDSMAYNRASIHLLAFKKAILDQTKRLLDAQAWLVVIDHAVMAWLYVKSTPVWDNQPHNNPRRQCFKVLASHSL